MPYTADKPPLPETSEELRARIPGWGADLDLADRPSVPRERFDPGATGAHWVFPEQQVERWPRERSIEHARTTPVFGTSCPPHGPSGAVRRLAYRRYSEARAAHWLLLLGADRIDAAGAHLRSLGTRGPDDPITESGILSEPSRHGFSSRVGRTRVDGAHQWIDPIVVVGPWLLAAWGGWSAVRGLVSRVGATRGQGRSRSGG